MQNRIPRLAVAVFAALSAVALVDATVARAADDPVIYSTTCGAGTVERCGEKPLVDCDWVVEIGGGPGRLFNFKISKTNCRVIGSVPIYKNMQAQSTLSGSCNALAPLLGMPAGSGCSDDAVI